MGSRRGRIIGLMALAFIAAYFQLWWLAASLMAAAIAEAALTVEEADPDIGRKLQMNTRTTQAIIKLVYGIHKVGSNEVFIDSGGEDRKWLYIVDSLGEGECEGIYQEEGVDQIWLDENPYTDYPSGLRHYTFHNGSAVQTVDADLLAAFPSHTDPYRYTCYVMWRLKYNEDYFVRAPTRTCILKGLKVYDFRSSGQFGRIPADFPSDENLVGFWAMDEESGTDVEDLSGTGNDGTIGGNPSWEDGIASGKCLDFDQNDYVNCGADPSLRITGDRTFTAWIELSAGTYPNGATNWTILDNENYLDDGFVWRLAGGTGKQFFRTSQAAAQTSRSSDTAIGNNTKRFVAVVVESNVVTFYLDGEPDGAGSITAQMASNQNFTISHNNQGFDGKIDEVRAYNRALTASEIQALYDFPGGKKWSNNAVLCLYDYMISTRYGKSISASKIDIDSWTDVANYCDAQGWTLNYAIGSNLSAQTIVDTIKRSFRGEIIHFNNKVYLRYADLDLEVPVLHIKDEHFALEPESGKAIVEMYEPSRLDVPDGFRIKYIDPDKDWSTDDIPIGDSIGNVPEFSAIGMGSKQQALDIGVYFLERARLNRGVRGTFRDDLLVLDPHDLVTITSTPLGISGEYFRVRNSAIRSDGLVDTDFIYEAPELYNDDYDLDEDEIYSSVLIDPKLPPPEVHLPSVTEETYYYRLRTFTRLHIQFSEPLNYPWYDYCQVWVKRTGDSDYRYLYPVNTDFTIDPVEENQTYLIKLRPVSIWGVKRSLDSISPLNHTVTGKVDAPSSLPWLAAIVAEQSVNLYSVKVDDPDVELYEFRLGAWTGGAFMGAFRSPNLSLKGVRPGTHIFYANTLSNNAIYGEIPRSATAKVPTPKGWALEEWHATYYNMVKNGHFNVNVMGWSGVVCSIASVPGGPDGTNCLELTRTAGTYQYVYQNIGNIFEELTLRLQFDVKSGTGGDRDVWLRLRNVTDADYVGGIETTSTSEWVRHSTEIVIPAEDLGDFFNLRIGRESSEDGTMLYDNVECIPIDKFTNAEHTIYSNGDYLRRAGTAGWSLVKDLSDKSPSQGQVRSFAKITDTICLAGTDPDGQIWRSTNAGVTWSLIKDLSNESPSQTRVWSLARITDSICLAGTGMNGQIWRSTDAGLNWSLVKDLSNESPSQDRVYSLARITDSICLAGTSLDGQIWRSTDAGVTWSLVKDLSNEDPGQYFVWSLARITDSICLAGTEPNGQIWRSTDAGANWSLVKDLFNESPSQPFVLALARITDSICLAGTYGNAQIWRSTDAGANWSLVKDLSNESPIQSYLWSLDRESDSICLASTGPNAQIWRSADAGANWSLVKDLSNESPAQLHIYALAWIADSIYLAGTYGDGQIWRSTGGLYAVYTSLIMDTGSQDTRMVWADVTFTSTGGGTTWEDLFPPGFEKWNQVITGKKWYELVELEAAPTIRMKLMWDDSYSGDFTNEAKMMEIVSAITEGRYYKMQVEIFDPNEAIKGLVSSMVINFYT